MLVVNASVPAPSVVFVDNAMVGLGDVLQTTPRAVTDEPPSDVMLPPINAVVVVMDVASVVVSVVVVEGIVFRISLTTRTDKPFLLLIYLLNK